LLLLLLFVNHSSFLHKSSNTNIIFESSDYSLDTLYNSAGSNNVMILLVVIMIMIRLL